MSETLTPANAALCADILSNLPGEWTITNQGDSYARIRRPDGLELSLSFKNYPPKRVEARPAVPMRNGRWSNLRDWGLGTVGQPADEPTAGCSMDRGGAAIARDIARKVLAPYEPLYAGIQARQAEDRDNRAAIEREAAALQAMFPKLRVELAPNSYEASVSGGAGLYLSARLYSNGSLCLDRMASLGADKARRVLAILLEG